MKLRGEGQGYQTAINQALRNYIKQDKQSIQEIVREAVRKELKLLKEGDEEDSLRKNAS